MLLNIIPNYTEPILKYYFRDFIFTFKFQKKKKEEIGGNKNEDFNFFLRRKNLLALGYFEI